MKLLTKQEVGLAFSKAAATYDEACDFQKETGRELTDKVLRDAVHSGRILDIGMGTGRITQGLYLAFNRPVFGCDIAWGMVSFSKTNCVGVIPAQADMEKLPYKTGIFDIVFSNIAHQWGRDNKSAFLEAKRILKAGGRFYFSILAKGSLPELYESIKTVTGKDYGKDIFPDPGNIRSELVNSGFEIDGFETKTLRRYYKNSFELIKKLKDIGAGRVSEANIFGMGRRSLFLRMLEEYNRRFGDNGKVFASYNVVSGCARK